MSYLITHSPLGSLWERESTSLTVEINLPSGKGFSKSEEVGSNLRNQSALPEMKSAAVSGTP